MEKKKMVTVELRTGMNNNDLKNLFKSHPYDGTVVDQVHVSLMQPVKKEKK